jgi:hypothetical protein
MAKDKAAEEPTKAEAETVAADEAEPTAEQQEALDLAESNAKSANEAEEESLERIRQQGHT